MAEAPVFDPTMPEVLANARACAATAVLMMLARPGSMSALEFATMRDLARRRVRVFETMLPFRLAANIKRYQSPFLMAEYGRVITVERELVMRLLPAPVLANKVAAEALCATLSFQNWRALRHDQGLPAEEAGTVTAHMVEALLAALPQGGDR